MALIVEDGTGLATAESYCAVAFADSYFDDRGNASWAALATAGKEQALRKATDYMIQVYTSRWQGYRIKEIQALDWPRYNVVVNGWLVDSDIVPSVIARACAEFAIKASAGTLLNDLKRRKASVTVGPIKTQYEKHAPERTRYPAIDAMLMPYLKSGGSANISLERC